MSISRMEVGETPRLRLGDIGGSLRVTGREDTTLEARSQEEADLSLQATNGGVEIECRSDCTLLVPQGSSLEAGLVGGAVNVTGVTGELLLRTVGGGLRLRQVGKCSSENVGGDVIARGLSGPLSIDAIGGGARVDDVAGEVRLRSVGGDLRLSRVRGLVEVSVGGDAGLRLEPPKDTISRVHAGGDINCVLPEGVSVSVRVRAGRDVRLAVPAEASEIAGGCQVDLGEAQATLELTAGADILVRTGQEQFEGAGMDLGEAIADRVGAEIEAQMVDLEARLSGLGERMQAFDSERINRKIRQAVAKAQRKAARARRRAAHRARQPEVASASAGSPVEQERLMILQMIANGKLTVDEAEKLLSSLEG